MSIISFIRNVLLLIIFGLISCHHSVDEKSIQEKDIQYVKEYTEDIKNDPKDQHAYSMRGKILFSLGYYEKAYDDFHNALKIDNDYVSYYYLTAIYMLNDNYSEAYKCAKRALKSHPDLQLFHGMMGTYYDLTYKNKEAVDEYDKFVNKGLPKDLIKEYYAYAVLLRRGIVNYRLQEYEKSLKDITTLIEVDDENCNLYYLRFKIKVKMGNNKGAREDLRDSLRCGFNDIDELNSFVKSENKIDKKEIEEIVSDNLIKSGTIKKYNFDDPKFIIRSYF